MTNTASGDAFALPLVLCPRILPKVWGGRRLAAIYRDHVPHAGGIGAIGEDTRIGEAWLAWAGSVVEGGPHDGRTVADLVREAPEEILGERASLGPVPVDAVDSASPGFDAPRFPTLVKLLDTSAWLSVQVHPDDAYARRVDGEPFGKTEMWLVLAADEGAEIIHGLNRPATGDELRTAVGSGTLLDMLRYRPVAAGDVVYNPAGTIHALGAGILLFEVQQASDLTYRLYDWDRSGGELGRPLHVDKALEVARLAPEPAGPAGRPDAGRSASGTTELLRTPYFTTEEIRASEPVEGDTCRRFQILTLVKGRGRLEWKGGSQNVAAPETLLLPAALGTYRLLPDARHDPQGLWVLRVS